MKRLMGPETSSDQLIEAVNGREADPSNELILPLIKSIVLSNPVICRYYPIPFVTHNVVYLVYRFRRDVSDSCLGIDSNSAQKLGRS